MMNNMTFELDEVKRFINSCSDETRIYIGTDSERYRKGGVWFADYTTVVVVHIDGHRGCKVFGKIETEQDYDAKKNRPSLRLMNEVYKVADMFNDLKDVLERFRKDQIEVHIDINGKKEHGSNIVLSQAIGYVRGVTGVEPKFKPNAPAASFAADRWKQVRGLEYTKYD